MSASEMVVASSDSDNESTGTRSPMPTHVPIELYHRQLDRVDQLEGEQAMLTKTIQELRQELRELRQSLAPQAPLKATTNAPAQERPKRKKEPTSSDDEDSHQERQPTQPRKKTPEAPTQRAPTAAERDPQKPGPSRDSSSEIRETPEETNKAPKIPPVMVRKKERWTQVSHMLRSRGIQYPKARLTNEDIAVTAATVTDYRKMTAAFNDTREKYHTYTLEEDRLLRVVVRREENGATDVPGPDPSPTGPEEDPRGQKMLLPRSQGGETESSAAGDSMPPLPEIRPRTEPMHRGTQMR